MKQHVAALFLDPGLGKTSIVLEAFCRLQNAGTAKTMLVVAPLRVCQTVWRQEGQKWTQFRHLRFSLLHGAKKEERLKDASDIWLINPEGVMWLAKQFFGRPLPWDIVTIDELTKFKNHQAERSKALAPRIKGVRGHWGLTGTPAPNGLMDLFGQFHLLDGGAALGKYITHFRDQYFTLGYDGFSYEIMPGAEKRIEERIRPYVLRMGAEDYLTLPPLVEDIRFLDLDAKARGVYNKMKKDMLAALPEGTVTAANAAATYSKLKQMANGAVYVGDDKDSVSVIHDIKLEAIDDLLEELAGQQLLFAYEFRHDAARLQAHFGDRLTVLASGMSEKATAQIVDDWNAGRIQFLAAHPASAAHGLNLQQSACAHVAWMGPTWDLELYLQFIRRVRRQGNDAQRIFNHLFVVRDSIDELALEAVNAKDTTQTRLLRSLNSILHDADNPPRGADAATRRSEMVAKLSREAPAGGAAPSTGAFKGWGTAPTTQPAQEARTGAPTPEVIKPRGWGSPAPTGQPAASSDQRERMHEVLTTGSVQGGFSSDVREHMATLGGAQVIEGQVHEVVHNTGRSNEEITQAAYDAFQKQPQSGEPAPQPAKRTRKVKEQPSDDSAVPDQLLGARIQMLHIAFADPSTTLDDGLEIARSLMEFVTGG